MSWMRSFAGTVRCRLFEGSLAVASASSLLATRALHCDGPAQASSSPSPPDARTNKLGNYGLGDIPTTAYKAHFTDAYDSAASQSAANVARRSDQIKVRGSHAIESLADLAIRHKIAIHLMAKLGYTEHELEFLGDDVLRMQGVCSPFHVAKLTDGETVLDLGSGFGTDAFLAAAKVGPKGRVLGVDLSAEEVQRAQSRAQERGLDKNNCTFLQADMENLPLNACSIDVVMSNGGFCLCPNKSVAFEEVHRVLKPGGRCAISCTVLRKTLPCLEDKRWPPCMEVFMPSADIRGVLHNIGFKNISVDDSNSRMDVWDLTNSDVDSLAQDLETLRPSMEMGCSHARKAAHRQGREQIDSFLSRDREAGIHWGNPAFAHVKDFDMNELCARVVIYAEKKS